MAIRAVFDVLLEVTIVMSLNFADFSSAKWTRLIGLERLLLPLVDASQAKTVATRLNNFVVSNDKTLADWASVIFLDLASLIVLHFILFLI